MTKTLSRFLYGGDYNPDQWTEETWPEDIKVFKKVDLNSATINISLGQFLNLEKESMTFLN